MATPFPSISLRTEAIKATSGNVSGMLTNSENRARRFCWPQADGLRIIEILGSRISYVASGAIHSDDDALSSPILCASAHTWTGKSLFAFIFLWTKGL